MPDQIRKAVSIQRDLIEGGKTEKELHSLIERFAQASLYAKPMAATNRLKAEVMARLARKFLPLARQTGIESATPILGAMDVRAVPIRGGIARELTRRSKQTVELFVAHVEQEIDWHLSSTRVAFLEARHNGVKRAALVRDLVKADKAELASISEALAKKDKAAAELAVAEKRLAARPRSTPARQDLGEARLDMRKAKASVKGRRTFLARLEVAIQGHARDAIRRESYDAQNAAFKAAGFTGTAEYMWVAVNGSDACPSCSERHGQTRKLSDWSGDDPGAGNTYCGSACMCQLVPTQYTENNPGLTQPLEA